MHLIYVRFDLIVFHENLDKLKKFTKLRKLVLAHNYLNSYILLSKIECLQSVQTIQMYENEVMQCVTLPSFITYRFQHITEVSPLANDPCSITARKSARPTRRRRSSSSSSLTKSCRSKTSSPKSQHPT